jgi:uncharacterized protein YbjQ (UPF0145 family)
MIRQREIKGGAQMGVWFVALDENRQFIKEEENTAQEQSSPLSTRPSQSDVSAPTASEIWKKKHYRTPKQKIALSTLEYVSGKQIEEIELIAVSSVQSVNFFKGFGAEVRSHTIGGKSNSMSELLENSRDELLKALQEKAHKLRADAVIGIRFSTGEVLQAGLELMAYGTAVKVSDKSEQ